MADSAPRRPVILILVPIYTPIAYGASYAAQLLLESDFSTEYELHLINTRFAESAADVGKISFKKLGLFLKYFLQLVVALLTVRPDYVILNPGFNRSAFLKDSLYHVVCAVLMRRKVIWWAHNWGFRRLSDRTGFLMRRYIRFVVGTVYAVVTPGDRQHTDFDSLIDTDKIHTISYGLPPESYAMERFSEHQDICVLYLSNFALTKGWRVMLEAAKMVCEIRKNVRFEFVGNVSSDTSLSDIDKAFSTLQFSDRIIYCGPAYGSAKHNAFERADIFCFPTFYPMETFGIVNIEAMNAGLPIITTDHANIPEIVIDGEGGILIPKQDSVALMKAIVRLSDDWNVRHRMGAFNQRRFYERYTVERFLQGWINLIRGFEDEQLSD